MSMARLGWSFYGLWVLGLLWALPASAVATCPTVPSDICYAAGKEKFLIKADPNKLKWKWSNGLAPFGQADFGDPVNGGTNFTLCVYDRSAGSPVFTMSATIDAGGTCGTKPCWKQIATKGWLYKNKAGNTSGITKLLLKGGGPTQSKLQIKGQGTSLALPAPISASEFFDQDPAVIVQLYSSTTPNCWSSTFVAASTKKNDATHFTANQSGAVPATPAPRRVFVTSQTYTGNLGGLAGADALCQARAAAAGLSGTYKAWLADDVASPATRLTHSPGTYVLVDGTVVADSWTDLTDGAIDHAIDKTESNGPPTATGTICGETGDRLVWSNVTSFGGLFLADYDCTDWTNGTGSLDNAMWGDSSRTDNLWSAGCNGSGLGVFCNILASLYCFEQ